MATPEHKVVLKKCLNGRFREYLVSVDQGWCSLSEPSNDIALLPQHKYATAAHPNKPQAPEACVDITDLLL